MSAFLANIYLLGNLARNIYIADFLDVAIIALFIYGVIVLFKQTHSLPAFFGIATLAVLYWVAQAFDLYLTSLALQVFFGTFLVVLVVIFQQELRRFFEFIAIWGTHQYPKKSAALTSKPIQEILQACAHLARERIGGLIVLVGNESIDRHLNGGKQIDGIISEELLLSIFDPDSPGHDGAVIIQKDRIDQFGAHLPLSHNFKEIGKHGMRHSAALGITEQSDGLAIIISEEKGAVSVAREGRLTALKNIDELERHIQQFLKEHFPEAIELFWERMLRRNSTEKVVAVVLASALWFFVSYPTETVNREFAVPIGYRNLSQTMLIEDANPKEFAVTLSGRGERIFEQLDPKALEVVIDGKSIQSGANKFRIIESMVARPANFSVITILPTELQIIAKQFSLVTVPIEVVIIGTPAQGFRVGRIAVTPSAITLLVPEQTEAPAKVSTEPITISGLHEPLIREAKLKPIAPARLQHGNDGVVTVTISIVPR
ncbi:hypothetical protein A3J56_03210 [Candidatus Giovannonibacteria bacterium RIFCSPHIGHO2_02_FULL_46_20]|uniref:Diadenylate cyclase n=1 Tax=Candidatus Giovannonibacteria bacterium RIFCSPHIGHO2_02_FULL_46_20 TaxID=1798338 RepID=A0A1F5WGG7_9BACT|nr:MAG: hypothetical protein A3J56_03210 [Candidatus Giovannonibacteria bacterium RIFCSPHIGHO2_02_FULL_46_20]